MLQYFNIVKERATSMHMKRVYDEQIEAAAKRGRVEADRKGTLQIRAIGYSRKNDLVLTANLSQSGNSPNKIPLAQSLSDGWHLAKVMRTFSNRDIRPYGEIFIPGLVAGSCTYRNFSHG